MRFKCAAIMGLFLLAGCTGQPDNASTLDAGAECSAQFYYPFPDAGLKIPFQFHFRSDRMVEAENDKGLRRIIELEVVQDDPRNALNEFKKSLSAAHYVAIGKESIDDSGVSRQSYAKQGMPALFVAMFPDAGKVPSHPAATGRIWISWPVDQGLEVEDGPGSVGDNQ